MNEATRHKLYLKYLAVDRDTGCWEGWIDTEDGTQRMQFDELREAYRWATHHGARIIALTY